MIKILGVCGSRVKDGNMEALLRESFKQLDIHPDAQGEIITLAGRDINGCTHCNWCVRNQEEGRFCVQDDGMTEIFAKVLEADGLVVASPAHLGRLSGILANMIDRLRAFVHGNVYKRQMKNKIGGAMAIAYFRGGGIETTLLSINLLFLTLQMILATSGLYQMGAGAFSTRNGLGQFEKEPRHLVLEDEYGVMSGRMLLDRVYELARTFQAGRAALEKNG
ncbi:MAG: flavodoxin family protein [Proteobacteria bacterium]|nr:flavodoxin family protein [Pseudomonadota bacterium]